MNKTFSREVLSYFLEGKHTVREAIAFFEESMAAYSLDDQVSVVNSSNGYNVVIEKSDASAEETITKVYSKQLTSEVLSKKRA